MFRVFVRARVRVWVCVHVCVCENVRLCSWTFEVCACVCANGFESEFLYPHVHVSACLACVRVYV